MDYSEIIFRRDGAIAYLTLNRPDIRNAITSDVMIEEIVNVCDTVQADEAIRVLVVTGAGTCFSAGGNVKDMHERKGMFSGNPEQLRDNYRKGIQRIPLAFNRLDVPTIAAVNGPAIGAGCDLACMCDMRIAAESARFGETFVSVGLIPGDGGAFFLPRIVGFAKACELTFTSRIVDAAEALRIGLVNEVVPSEQLPARARQLAEEIARQPGKILRMAKRLLYLAQNKTLQDTLELSAAFQALCHYSPEHRQALEAFFARQKAGGK
ncbi:crotonase/enoyl-CoA hydratase family protein [Desulfoferrobacter suflitae]|uniref:crotonase/enoyl-CoA hydratase family protein n=1 Tax=Desulfoferrobacter suflitae TaxID=2865782 RepID=UPI002164889B|nr:crotonase/enoyl-CoA hydratase family protein [Desulfoferrobacter suflitae]MCK8604060.1 crotonase/enoyl-CoA hydratase family protein [Desulfoferrobacter suflitae]